VILFEEDMQEFLRGFDESLRILEKAAREKRRRPAGSGAERPPKRRGEGDFEKNSADPPAKSRGRVLVKKGKGKGPSGDRNPGV
jgi:hypothetical protein